MMNPYLRGNYAPLKEEISAFDLPIQGALPPELNGVYLRNGPNPVQVDEPEKHHWFLGSGMVHGVRLTEGRAEWYRNRWVMSEPVARQLGRDPDGLGEQSPNTHVIAHAGRLFALVEAGGAPVELSPTLETLGENRFFSTLEGGFTAHPKLDPDTGELHAMCYSAELFNKVQYLVIGKDGRMRRKVTIELPNMIMLHDMSLTQRYAVLYDLPVTFSMELLERGYTFPFCWNPDHEPRIGLLPREGEAEDIIWCPVQPGYVFHPMNAYDREDGSVVMDLCRYERMFEGGGIGPFAGSPATLDRWIIDPDSRHVDEQRIDDRGQEFPRCHPGFVARPYRYGYCVGVGEGFAGLLKHDLLTGRAEEFVLPGVQFAEPNFVPRIGARNEDDGYLIGYAWLEAENRSDLMVLDARDPGAPPLARVRLPQRVPHGFHGTWVADGQSSAV